MAKVQIVHFGAFYGPGAKSQNSDKIWGVAVINGTCVSFWGKRNRTLSFKTRTGATGRQDAEIKWYQKIGGRKSGDVYTPVTSEKIRKILCPNLTEQMVSFYYSKMSRGMLKTG